MDKLSTESKFIDVTFFVTSPKRRQNICNCVMFYYYKKEKYQTLILERVI